MFFIVILILFAVNFFLPCIYISIYSHLTNSRVHYSKQDKPNAFCTDLNTVVTHQLQLEVIVAS